MMVPCRACQIRSEANSGPRSWPVVVRPATALATGSYITVTYHCILARNPRVDPPVDPKSHIPRHPKPDPRTKRCRHWSKPIVYMESARSFANCVALEQSEGVLFLQAKSRVRFPFYLEVRFSTMYLNSPKKIITKITNVMSKMDRVLSMPSGI